MVGIGKTTLAWKIFEDGRIKYEFPIKIWVNVSENLNWSNVLLTILDMSKYNVDPHPPYITLDGIKDKVREHQ